MVDSLLESQGKILGWDGRTPLYQSHYDNLWKNTPTDKLSMLHGQYKSSFEGGTYGGVRSMHLAKRMPQKFRVGSIVIGQTNSTHRAFHSAKALEKELANRKIDFKPIELKLPITKKVSKFKTETNIFKSLLSNVKKLGPALKGTSSFSGKVLPIVGPLLQIKEMKKQYEGLMEPKEPPIY